MTTPRDDIIASMVACAERARQAGIGIMDFREMAADAYNKAIEADPSWEGPIDGALIRGLHVDEDQT